MSSTMEDFDIGSGFTFSAVGTGDLTGEAVQFTLVTIALDETGSISGHEREIERMLQTTLGACRRSPYSHNIMVRIIRFGSQYTRSGGGGVDEMQGFAPLTSCDPATYPALRAGGMTPLYDAVYSSVGAANVYAKQLIDLDYAVNGITFVVTDGGENASVASAKMVQEALATSVRGEVMESHYSILIGIDTGASDVESDLQAFQREAGIDQFIWAGEATKGNLAKLAQFISTSITSTSQALGTGGPSTQISATI